jgi:ABC-type proline/glycine betaine transport system ATPase subunit
MFIARGLPGSGKSTLVKLFARVYDIDYASAICSGDDYFMDKDNVYRFDASKLKEAHENARLKAEKACK